MSTSPFQNSGKICNITAANRLKVEQISGIRNQVSFLRYQERFKLDTSFVFPFPMAAILLFYTLQKYYLTQIPHCALARIISGP